MTVLVLGGTAEARALAARTPVLSSLAGRVGNPRMPEGETRIGGFGGADGLAAFLADAGIDAVVDATHPFAATISANAAEACARTGVPLLRFERPGWSGLPGAERWSWVDSHAEAAVRAALGQRVFLSTGRQSLPSFLALPSVVARVVEPTSEDVNLPEGWLVVLDRGPYSHDAERALLREHRIDVLVTKDSGGDYTRPKLDAADELGIEVVVVRRPAPPPGVATVSDLDAVVDWLAAR
ncbi:MAG TPA: cobalt-precorrin-6A reductase [Nocardioidaceae bacterium]|nr:cobalt-precorrin-6A reductase [Nocardioidaceae bacterium]